MKRIACGLAAALVLTGLGSGAATAKAPAPSTIEDVSVTSLDEDLFNVSGRIATSKKCLVDRTVLLQIAKPGGGFIEWDRDKTDSRGAFGLLAYDDDIADPYRIRLGGTSDCGPDAVQVATPFRASGAPKRAPSSPSEFGDIGFSTFGDSADTAVVTRVAADRAACRSDRKVVMQTFDSGKWVTVTTDSSSRFGAVALYGRPADLDGTVRLRMPSQDIKDAEGKFTCTGDVRDISDS